MAIAPGVGGENIVSFPDNEPFNIAQIGGVAVSSSAAGTMQVKMEAGAGTMAVYFSPANPAVAATFSGSIATYFDPSGPAVNVARVGGNAMASAGVPSGYTPTVANIWATGVIPATVSSSTSTAGNNTVVSPEASHNIKVYAYSLSTTGIVPISPRFTTGASAGATELWRVALQAASATGTGANLAVQPPGYLFAAGTGNTLALYLDSGTLTHYSVSYFKESA